MNPKLVIEEREPKEVQTHFAFDPKMLDNLNCTHDPPSQLEDDHFCQECILGLLEKRLAQPDDPNLTKQKVTLMRKLFEEIEETRQFNLEKKEALQHQESQ